MINIANFLLTRKCNLSCEYCRISGELNYVVKPPEYPDSTFYFKNERDASFWISIADMLYGQNKDVFIILYGGEPLLYPELAKLVKHLNKVGINYTIISNCSDQIQTKAMDLFNEVGTVRGFTASVDPGFWLDTKGDEYKKSKQGASFLKKIFDLGITNDPVAEITVDNQNIVYLEETVQRLTDKGIYSDITVLDIAKNNYYDFSSITNVTNLVYPNEDVMRIFKRLVDGNHLIHMKESLLPKIFEILPAEIHCNMHENLDNVTIDADGSLRLCLRIRGRFVPKHKAEDLFGPMTVQYGLMDSFGLDYTTLCLGCNWTCRLMSQLSLSDVLNH